MICLEVTQGEKCAWSVGSNEFYLSCAAGKKLDVKQPVEGREYEMSICENQVGCFSFDQHKTLYGVATWEDNIGDCLVLGTFNSTIQPTFSNANNGSWTFTYPQSAYLSWKPTFQCDPYEDLKMVNVKNDPVNDDITIATVLTKYACVGNTDCK